MPFTPKTQNDLAQASHSEPLPNAEKLARHRLIRTPNVGPITFRYIINQFGSALAALEHLPDFAQRGRSKKPLKIADEGPILQELKGLKKINGFCLHLGSTDYPELLAQLEDAPPILFARGHAALSNTHISGKPTLGIVGARNASASGIRLTQEISTALSEEDIIITSGLARGIDTAAHKASLKGGTIACLAGGIDIIYPPENAALYDAIAEAGLLLSEMPLSTKPQARHFPRRNRIISGLSQGILVVEAAEKSGSLITARYAADQGRDVFALPGSPADPRARGCNRLIKDGAILVQSAEDIIAELSAPRPNTALEPSAADYTPRRNSQVATPTDKERQQVTELLSPTAVPIDDLIRLTQMPAGHIHAIILELELAGRASRVTGNKVCLSE